MGRFIAYGCLIVAVIAGFKLAPAFIIPLLALVSTLFMVRGRLDIDKNKVRAEKPNLLVEGAFLFAAQLLIIFVAYLLGYFAGSDAGTYFMDFVTGNRA